MNLPSMMKMTKPINFDNALLSVASLNRENNSIEMAKDYTGTLLKFQVHLLEKKDGKIYATETLNFKQGTGWISLDYVY